MTPLRFVVLTALPLVLAACQGEKKAQQGTATGEILPASVSDEMLPYDTVRSQPPLAPLPTATGKAGAKSSGGDEAAEDTAAGDEADSESSAAPAPAAAAPSAPAEQ